MKRLTAILTGAGAGMLVNGLLHAVIPGMVVAFVVSMATSTWLSRTDESL